MSSILGMNGRPIGEEVGTRSNQGKITQSQAGAIITSEIEIAVENWNVNALKENNNQPDTPIFKVSFEKFEYADKVKEAAGYFGYGQLSINLLRNGGSQNIYLKAVQRKTERDLDNTNGYYPDMAVDCIGMLLAAGLMYNLALADLDQQVKPQPDGNQTEDKQPPVSKKSKSGTRSKGKSDS